VYYGDEEDCSNLQLRYWYHPDYLGSVEYVTDENGEAYQYFFRSPWGKKVVDQKASGVFSSAYKFNGKEQDEETGNYYYGARYMNPDLGVWLSVNPVSHAFPSVTPYSLMMNNPVMMIDPGGDSTFFFDQNGNHLYTSNDKLENSISVIDKDGMTGFMGIVEGVENGSLENSDKMWQNARDHGTTHSIMNSDLGHMARVVYAEAAGQSAESKLAVAEVIRNRASDNTKPSSSNGYTAQFGGVSTYKDVANQKGQFESVQSGAARFATPGSAIKNNSLEYNAFIGSMGAAVNAHHNNTNTAGGATFFFSPYISAPGWTKHLKQVSISGVSSSDFKFYKF
jgi:RHS repeat-associated protein